jgi:hypothetical protein
MTEDMPAMINLFVRRRGVTREILADLVKHTIHANATTTALDHRRSRLTSARQTRSVEAATGMTALGGLSGGGYGVAPATCSAHGRDLPRRYAALRRRRPTPGRSPRGPPAAYRQGRNARSPRRAVREDHQGRRCSASSDPRRARRPPWVRVRLGRTATTRLPAWCEWHSPGTWVQTR